MCIKTEVLRFLDIKNYIAPGFFYEKFAKHTTLAKLNFFPYQCVDSLEKLNHFLSNHQAFPSNLKQANITAEEYQRVVSKWKRRAVHPYRIYWFIVRQWLFCRELFVIGQSK